MSFGAREKVKESGCDFEASGCDFEASGCDFEASASKSKRRMPPRRASVCVRVRERVSFKQ